MNASLPPPLHPPVGARDAVRTLRASRIREVANAGFGLPDVLPFWFGESDRVTPDFIRDAAAQAPRAAPRSTRTTSASHRCAAPWPTM